MSFMNKKGEDTTGPGFTLGTVLAVFVLVLVLIGGVWFGLGGGVDKIKNLIPGFNQTKPGVVNTEIFRYVIATDNLQYYDGTTWVDFKSGSGEFNGKVIDADTLKKNLDGSFIFSYKVFDGIDSYVVPPLNPTYPGYWERYKIYFKSISSFYQGVNIPSKAQILGGAIQLHLPGDKNIFYIKMGENNALYVLNADGGLDKISSEDNLISDDNKKAYNVPIYLQSLSNRLKIVAWRDSLVDNQVSVDFKNANDLSVKTSPIVTCYLKNYYKEVGKEALVVDLSRPLSVGGKCPY